MLTALLAGLAAGVLGLGPPSRVQAVLPARSRPVAPDRPAPRSIRAASLVAGLALWWLVGGLPGAALGVAAAIGGPRLLGRLDDTEGDEPLISSQLPLALELLGACLAGGAGTAAAVDVVGRALPGPLGQRLVRVGAALAVGSPPAEAWQALGATGPAGAAARALVRAAEGGAPVAAGVLRVAEDARRESRARSERAARRAGVLAVGPLGVCFLPAFLLLGVAPAIVGLAGPLLSSL